MTNPYKLRGNDSPNSRESGRGLVDVRTELARRLSTTLDETISARNRILSFRSERLSELTKRAEYARSQREETESALAMMELTRRLNGTPIRPTEAYLLERQVALRRAHHSILVERSGFEAHCDRRLRELDAVIVHLGLELGSLGVLDGHEPGRDTRISMVVTKPPTGEECATEGSDANSPSCAALPEAFVA